MNDKELWEKEQESKWFQRLKHLFSEDDVFWNNEIRANLFVSFCMIFVAAIIALFNIVLMTTGRSDLPMSQLQIAFVVNMPMLIVPVILCRVFKGSRHWIKYMLCICCLLVSISLTSILSFFVPLAMCIPVILSSRYYSRKFTIFVAAVSLVGMAAATAIAGCNGLLDLNLITVADGTVLTVTGSGGIRDAVLASGFDMKAYAGDIILGSFLPNALFSSIIAAICAELSRRAHEMVLEQTEVSRKTESIKTELNMATEIQSSVLPKIFPAFPTRPELDVSASMTPAKAVGGDFYDYYLLDEDHLMMVIADVSDKGVPAALFMMISKILIKTYAEIYKTPAAIASEVNKQLCADNSVEMFVTAWIGILEMSTGTITAVDAGHEYPLVRHKDGTFEYIKGKKSLVIAGMDDTEFREFTFSFERGDTIFLYTDGVMEALNEGKEMFGKERLLDSVNRHKDDTPAEMIAHVKEDIDAFTGTADQFDDMTMLAMKFRDDGSAK